MSTKIPATIAKGRNLRALEKKKAEKIQVKSHISPHESLLVAPEAIFIVVLGTSALTGIHQTRPVRMLVRPSQYTSR